MADRVALGQVLEGLQRRVLQVRGEGGRSVDFPPQPFALGRKVRHRRAINGSGVRCYMQVGKHASQTWKPP